MEDMRKSYLTEEQRVAQAKRLLPVVEAEIAGGETRQIFFDIRDMCIRDLADACYLGCYYEGRHPRCRVHNEV